MTHSPDAPPIVDISPLRVDSERTPASACVEAIHDACSTSGFFVATGHGLETEMDAVFLAARRFFALPEAEKRRTPRIDRYGFVPHAIETTDERRTSDKTEYLDMGLGDEIPLPDLEGFEPAVRAYQRGALALAASLLRAVAVGLGADPDFFAERMGAPQCRLRFLHYPAVTPNPEGVLPVPTTPHTDYGAITLLATDGVPGLEVRPLGAPWTPVVAPAGALVVNLGDMLARWTNDIYKSTPHRVVGPPDGERISIPFFVNPDPGTVVTCIPACVTEDRPAAYEPVTAGEFLAQRIDSSAEPYADPTEGPVRRVGVDRTESQDSGNSDMDRDRDSDNKEFSS